MKSESDKTSSRRTVAELARKDTTETEAAGFSELSVTFYQCTRRHILEDSNFHSHCLENFETCICFPHNLTVMYAKCL
jgi:hypothetical protein